MPHMTAIYNPDCGQLYRAHGQVFHLKTSMFTMLVYSFRGHHTECLQLTIRK